MINSINGVYIVFFCQMFFAHRLIRIYWSLVSVKKNIINRPHGYRIVRRLKNSNLQIIKK